MPHPISFVRPSIAMGQGLPALLQQVRACQICVARLPQLRLVLAIGQYAMAYHLPDVRGTLTEKVRGGCVIGQGGLPVFPLPHPSPRNNIWLARNPWFEAAVLPDLRQRVAAALLA